MKENSNDNIFLGLAVGAIVPILGFIVTETIFAVLTDMNLMEEAGTGVYSKRYRTMALIALCFNLIPFNIAKKKRWDNIMRGIVFPTLIYVGFWIYKYHTALF